MHTTKSWSLKFCLRLLDWSTHKVLSNEACLLCNLHRQAQQLLATADSSLSIVVGPDVDRLDQKRCVQSSAELCRLLAESNQKQGHNNMKHILDAKSSMQSTDNTTHEHFLPARTSPIILKSESVGNAACVKQTQEF